MTRIEHESSGWKIDFIGDDGDAVTLTGQLRFPGWEEHLPAVILLHGSNGVTSVSAYRWGELLNRMGIATFRLDSFGGRGIDQVETDQSRLSSFAQFYDTYRAVECSRLTRASILHASP